MSPTTTLAPEQVFSDPADVIDWLRNEVPINDGAGVSTSSDDCTLSRYARAKLGADLMVQVGWKVYIVSNPETQAKHIYTCPNWVMSFIARHDTQFQSGTVVPIPAAIWMLKEVVAELRAQATVDTAQINHPPLYGLNGLYGLGDCGPITLGAPSPTPIWTWTASPKVEALV